MNDDFPQRLRISEIFSSVQGEGASAGEPCTFLRLAHCNLRCSWCDTPYSWNFERYDYATEVKTLHVPRVAEAVEAHGEDRLVITGGEPLLQQQALAELLSLLPSALTVEVETNGTVLPISALEDRVDQWNVSPKLSSSGEPLGRRWIRPVLQALERTGRAWLKLVVAEDDDPAEIDMLVGDLRWPPERVLLMPEAASAVELRRAAPLVTKLAARRGFGVSPRLHVERWDGKRGR